MSQLDNDDTPTTGGRPGSATQRSTRNRLKVLLTGAIGAQAVGALSVPLVAGLFSPAAFGEFSSWWAGISLLGSLSTLSYERAILVSRSSRAARQAYTLSFLIVTLMAALVAVALVGLLIVSVPIDPIAAVLLAPLGVFLFGVYQSMLQVAIRTGQVDRIARSDVAGIVGTVAFQAILAIAFSPSSTVLLLGAVAGRAVYCSLLLPDAGWTAVQWSRLAALAVAHRRFPLFSAPYGVVSQLPNRALIILPAIFYSTEAAGLIALAHRLTFLPVTVLSGALRRAFLSLIRPAHVAEDSARRIGQFLRLTSALSIPVALGLGVVVPLLFRLPAFESWARSSDFIVLFLPGALALILTAWMDRIYDFFGMQSRALVLETIGATFVVGIFVVAILAGTSDHSAVFLFGASVLIYNIGWLCHTYRLAGLRVTEALWLSSPAFVGLIFIGFSEFS